MRDIFWKYKIFRKKLIRRIAQMYANLIIKQLDKSQNYIHFDYWINKGIYLDEYMKEKYIIYLD